MQAATKSPAATAISDQRLKRDMEEPLTGLFAQFQPMVDAHKERQAFIDRIWAARDPKKDPREVFNNLASWLSLDDLKAIAERWESIPKPK
jgi:hypothetical protein